MIKRLFKNIPLILAVFGITFALTGCGGTSSPASNNNNIVNGGNGNNGTPPSWRPPSAGLWCNYLQERVEGFTAITSYNFSDAVNFASDNEGAFTLAIGADVYSGQNILNQPNTDLTIIGIDGMRRIQFSTEVDNERLFYLDGDTISLTLGNNITLAGRSGSTVDLVRVMNAARLYMKEGSKITEHSTTSWGAVEIRNGSVFTMSGGTITGNTSTATGTNVPSGVFVTSESSRFYMTGGSISGNHRGGGAVPSDVSVSQTVDYFIMSGNAVIYSLILASTTDGTSNNAFITVDGWTGSVSRLDLRVNTTSAGHAAVIWAANPASPILQAAEGRTLSLDDVGRLLSVYSIGNAENMRQPIAPAHEIVLANGNTIAVLSE